MLARPAVFVSLDDVIRRLYAADFPAAQDLRESLAARFGRDVLAADGRDVDRPALAAKMFSPDCPAASRAAVHEQTAPLVEMLYRRAVAGFRGVVILEWAQLAEMDMGHWTNNRAIVVEAPDRAPFAAKRGITEARLSEMARVQWTTEQKLAALEDRARRDRHGSVIHYLNRPAAGGPVDGHPLRPLAEAVDAQFGF